MARPSRDARSPVACADGTSRPATTSATKTARARWDLISAPRLVPGRSRRRYEVPRATGTRHYPIERQGSPDYARGRKNTMLRRLVQVSLAAGVLVLGGLGVGSR